MGLMDKISQFTRQIGETATHLAETVTDPARLEDKSCQAFTAYAPTLLHRLETKRTAIDEEFLKNYSANDRRSAARTVKYANEISDIDDARDKVIEIYQTCRYKEPWKK